MNIYEEYGKFGCTLALIVIVVFVFVQAWIVQLLWNWLVPLFWTTAPILTYWQSFGCCILLGIIGGKFRSINNK